MANSASNIDLILTAQAFKEVVANSFFNAASPAATYAFHETASAGLVWGYYGGKFRKADSIVMIANGTLTLGANTTSYIEANAETGAVTQNLLGFTPGRIPLYTVVTGPEAVSSFTDQRTGSLAMSDGLAAITVGGDYTLSNFDAACRIFELSGSPGASFNLIFPARAWLFTISNGTGQDAVITVGSGGTVTVAAGKVADLYTKSGGVVRRTADI